MEENTNDFEEFAAAFNDGYQTGEEEQQENSETETQDAETSEEGSQSASEGPDSEQTDDPDVEHTEDGNGQEEPQEPPQEQKFTIKVNKESREVGRSEMTELAQRGADYDRVKGQLATARDDLEKVKAQFEESRKISDLLKRIAEDIGVPEEDMLRRVHINWRMNKGESEKEAIAHIESENAKRELNELKERQNQEKANSDSVQERASREIAEFRKEYPDVELTKELVEKLMPDVQGGTSLTNAYRKIEAARKDEEANALRAEIEKLQRQLKAEQQNKKNRSNSPGSQTDAGGRNAKSDFDEFAEAFK